MSNVSDNKPLRELIAEAKAEVTEEIEEHKEEEEEEDVEANLVCKLLFFNVFAKETVAFKRSKGLEYEFDFFDQLLHLLIWKSPQAQFQAMMFMLQICVSYIQDLIYLYHS